eukprot:scaffold50615_cov71-Phaeocystis_antarctica.AAC.2
MAPCMEMAREGDPAEGQHVVKVAPWQCPRSRIIPRLLRARLHGGGSALPGRGRPTGRPTATVSGARAIAAPKAAASPPLTMQEGIMKLKKLTLILTPS